MINNFRFWCQKVLPLVYDDSLSYYEVLCKVSDKVNEVIDSQNGLRDEVDKFIEKFNTSIYDIVAGIVNEWKNDGTLSEILSNISQSVINAVICGIDNTGVNDCGEDISNLLDKFTGRKIYFPKGLYKINTSVRMRTDDAYRGNILVCDSDAKFITDGVTTMFILGNGSAAGSLEKFGFDGGFIDCKGVTECGVKINNNQYSCVINNLLMRNCGDINAIQLGDGQSTSAQAYFSNLTITGDGSMKGKGLVIQSTDNYLININIGRMKNNLVLNGGGNLCSNIHTWDYGTELQALGISTPSEKLQYGSIVVNGSNNFANVQVDNGTPAIQLTQNAIQNTFHGVTFNYEEDFPWGKSTDECCCINVTGQQSTLSNTFHFDGVVFSPRTTNFVRLLKFFKYDRTVQFPFGFQWKCEYNASRANILRTMECDFARTIYKTTNCLSTYFSVSDVNKCCLVGYLGMNISTMTGHYKFYGVDKGEVDVAVTNNNGVITVNSTLVNSFSDNTNLLFGNATTTINGFVVVPVYYKPNSTGTRYNGLLVNPVSPTDVFNSFIPFRIPEWVDIPENTIAVKCYQ